VKELKAEIPVVPVKMPGKWNPVKELKGSMRAESRPLGVVSWNPVKELKAFIGALHLLHLIIPVESGEGIERGCYRLQLPSRYLVESGEGIERRRVLPASQPRSYVESGEGIESRVAEIRWEDGVVAGGIR